MRTIAAVLVLAFPFLGGCAGPERSGEVPTGEDTMGGLRARRSAIRQAEAAGAQQAQAGNQALVDRFTRAAGACLQGRGYTVG